MKRIFFAPFCALMAAGIFFAGCGGASRNKTGGKTTVTYWHIFPEGDAFKPVNDELIRRFNDSQDEVFVEDLGISFFDYLSKMDTALPAGTGPDIGFNGLEDCQRRAEAGVLVNLDKYIKADNVDMTQYYQSALKNITYNGGVYGMPMIWAGRILVYNKEMFREAGLDPDVPPGTVQELEQYADRLTQFDANGQLKVLGFHPSLGNVDFRDYVVSRDSDFFDESGKPVINNPLNVQILDWYVKMTNRYGVKQVQTLQDASKTTGIDPFLAGYTAMEVNVDDFYKKLSESGMDFGLAPIPAPASAAGGALGGGFDLEVINHNNEARARGAWEFVKFMTSQESQLYWAAENKWPTANQKALENSDIFKNDPHWSVIIRELPNVHPTSFFREAAGWGGLVASEVQAAQLGLKTPQQALDDAQAAVELEIQNFNAMN